MLRDYIDPVTCAFLASCLEEAGYTPSSPELEDAMVEDLLPRFNKWILLSLLEAVPDHLNSCVNAYA
jgi:hypothetical protein